MAPGVDQTGRERELKLLVDEGFVIPELDGVFKAAKLAEPESIRNVDRYFDAADLALARWGCTVRHRRGEGWTVKIAKPSSGPILDREEVLIPGEDGEPPASAVAVVAPLLAGRPLEPVAMLITDRIRRRWRDADGRVVAELVDDRVAATGPAEVERFREIEVELKSENARLKDLRRAADELVAAGARRGEPAPKLVRTLGRAAAGDPDVPEPSIGSRPTAEDVIRAAVATSVRRYLLFAPSAIVGADPEGVHQARVSSRRLRSDLKTFGPLLDPGWRDEVIARAKAVTDLLGAVRDTDVLDAKLRALLAEHPEIDPAAGALLERLAGQRQAARSSMVEGLTGASGAALSNYLIEVARHPGVLPAAERRAKSTMGRLVRKRWRRLDSAVESLGPEPAPAELHQVRILAKRVRYAAEAVVPALGRPARRFTKQAARIQDALGELNDAAVAGRWLGQAAEQLGGRSAFAAGQIAQQLMTDALVHEGDWRRAHQKMTKLTDWMD